MKTNFITYKTSVIYFSTYGSGAKWLFCFHGYGEDGSSFKMLEDALGKDYRLIAIDLPFHGATEWRDGLLLTAEDVLQIIDTIKGVNDEQISLLGFSMGGRIALSLVCAAPLRIGRVVLLAPDGLHVNFWNWAATKTSIGSKIFKYTVKQPKGLFALMKAGNATGLLNKSVFKFAHVYLDEEASRMLLYKRWTTLRKLDVNIHTLKDVIYINNITVRLLFGAYDRIILSKRAKYFIEGIEQLAQVRVIDAGHQLLQEKYADTIASLFYE